MTPQSIPVLEHDPARAVARTGSRAFSPAVFRLVSRAASRAVLKLAAGFALTLFATSCSSVLAPAPEYDFFALPDRASSRAADPWRGRIEDWQRRERAADDVDLRLPDDVSVRAAELDRKLSVKMAAFETGSRRKLAASIADWSRRTGRFHYKSDRGPGVSNDHWPTVGDLLASNLDDCDGLDLIAYQLLVEFGFNRADLYRAVLARRSGRGHHMVTLWFEDESDPWVFDATGAVTTRLVRFSKIHGWVPVRVFNDREQFTPRERGAGEQAGDDRQRAGEP